MSASPSTMRKGLDLLIDKICREVNHPSHGGEVPPADSSAAWGFHVPSKVVRKFLTEDNHNPAGKPLCKAAYSNTGHSEFVYLHTVIYENGLYIDWVFYKQFGLWATVVERVGNVSSIDEQAHAVALAKECLKYKAGEVVLYDVPNNALDNTKTIIAGVILKVDRMRVLVKSLAYINEGENYEDIHFCGNGNERWLSNEVMQFQAPDINPFSKWGHPHDYFWVELTAGKMFEFFHAKEGKRTNVAITHEGEVIIEANGNFNRPDSPLEIVKSLYAGGGWRNATMTHFFPQKDSNHA